MVDFNLSQAINNICISAIPLLLGIICHEVAHGWVAWRCGDPTAKMLGRLTLNPRVHIDPLGTLMFVVTAIILPFALGWAKPVPVNPRHFKNYRRDMALVAAAGPATNFILAVIFMALFLITVFVFGHHKGGTFHTFFSEMFQAGVFINLLLGIFNLIPIPPMDGSKLVAMALPAEAARAYGSLERYGMFIILIFLATGLFRKLIIPLVYACYSGLLWLFMQAISLFS